MFWAFFWCFEKRRGQQYFFCTKNFSYQLPDGTASLHSHEVRNGLVLLLLDSQGSLGAERLLGRLIIKEPKWKSDKIHNDICLQINGCHNKRETQKTNHGSVDTAWNMSYWVMRKAWKLSTIILKLWAGTYYRSTQTKTKQHIFYGHHAFVRIFVRGFHEFHWNYEPDVYFQEKIITFLIFAIRIQNYEQLLPS